jgi:hypothetical protein
MLRWQCQRCGDGGEKCYATREQAQRYAQAFDREDSQDLGRRAPFVGLLPLRAAWMAKARRNRSSR